MDTNKQPFSDYLRRLRFESGLSTAKVAELSHRNGSSGISSGYISMIENGAVKNVSPEKLKTLARIFKVTDTEMFAMAAGTNTSEFEITEERLARINFGYKDMPPSQRKQLDPIIDLLEREYQRIVDQK